MKKMRVLFLSKYGPLAASTRYRSIQFFDYLAAHGIECEVSPFFGDGYLRKIFNSDTKSAWHGLSAYFSRLGVLTGRIPFDCAVVHIELFPYLPAIAESLLRHRLPIIYDMDDAFFHKYDQHGNPLVRKFLKNKILNIIGHSSAVLAGNSYLADYARQTNEHVHIMPTVVDTQRYRRLERENSKAPFTIGWIGSPSTAPYLKGPASGIAEFCRQYDSKVTLIGSGPIEIPQLPLEILPWNEDTEVADINNFDVGIMPLPDTLWARGKCAFKLIQYMACGIPVIASPVGMNAQLVRHGVEGFLVNSDREWFEALEFLWKNPERRREMGAKGRQRIEAEFSLATTAPRLESILRSVVSGNQ